MTSSLRASAIAPLLVLTAACASTAGSSTFPDGVAPTTDAVAPTDVQPDVTRGRRESCNGVDDDLDGRTDEGCPIRVTRDARQDFYPSLSGRRLAWSRFEQIQTGDSGEILVRDLPDGEERVVATNGAYPSLSGDRVAFLRGTAHVVVDLTTGRETVLTRDDAAYVQAPFLDGDRVVWSQNMRDTEEDYEVFVEELTTRTRFRVGTDPTIQQFPLLRGNTLVWNDDRFGHHTVGLLHLIDVFRADLSQPQRPPAITQVTRREGELWYDNVAALDADRVTLTEYRGPLLGPYMPRPCTPVLLDLRTGARTPLAPETRECYRAGALSGHRAVLEYDPDGASDLFIVDLRTGLRHRVTTYTRRSTRARLEGDLLVWQDDRNDTWDLYMMDLHDMDEGDFYPEGVSP